MTNRMEQEYRNAEFSNKMTGELFPAAIGILGRAGWRWQNDSIKQFHGWWTLRDSEQARPMGDSKEIGLAAYKTVQLYTDIPFQALADRAAEIRREEMARLYAARG